MRASFSKRSGLDPAEAAQDSGYSICIAFTQTICSYHGRKKRKFGKRRLVAPDTYLQTWPEEAGVKKIKVTVMAREEQPPHFQTVLALGGK
jgi:hypothetical protein